MGCRSNPAALMLNPLNYFTMARENHGEHSAKGTGSFDPEKNTPPENKPKSPEVESESAVIAEMRRQMDQNNKEWEKRFEEMSRQLQQATNLNAQVVGGITNAMRTTAQRDGEWPKTVLPADDYLPEEEAVSFFSYVVVTVLTTDRRQNQESYAPLGPIVFNYLAGFAKKEGREEHIVNLCGYTSQSKTEIAWIRNHSLFKAGVICERYNTSISNGAIAKAQRASVIYNVIRNLHPASVVNRCREAGLHVTEDIELMKALLVEHMVEQEINQEKERTGNLVLAQSRDKYLEKANPNA